MAQRLGFGESIPTLGIKRCDIGPGYTGYFIPLVRDVLAKQIAYVSGFGSVEVDQASMIEFKLNPTNYYFLLVARLDTDIQSVQATLRSESITVEYLRLTQNQYQDYLRAWEVNPQAQAVSFTKETRKNKDGKDVSSLKYTLAGFNITPGIAQRLEQLRAQPDVIDRLFQEVDATTSQSIENYRKWLSSQAGGVVPQGIPASAPAQQLPPMPSQAPTAMPYHGGSLPQGTPVQSYPSSGYGQAAGVPSQSGQPIYTGQPIPPVGGAPTPSYGGPAPAGAPMGGSQPFGQMPGPIGFEEATPIDDSFGDLPIDGGF